MRPTDSPCAILCRFPTILLTDSLSCPFVSFSSCCFHSWLKPPASSKSSPSYGILELPQPTFYKVSDTNEFARLRAYSV